MFFGGISHFKINKTQFFIHSLRLSLQRKITATINIAIKECQADAQAEAGARFSIVRTAPLIRAIVKRRVRQPPPPPCPPRPPPPQPETFPIYSFISRMTLLTARRHIIIHPAPQPSGRVIITAVQFIYSK
ncbi:hypothetical protein [Serratia ficaria]|uniref:hypothetical protein n=1 Tax=Serratia ficaria TaxID=61651 RepID=UPI0021C89FE8|nr:hypothetical protein [Serratia ficaria]